MDNSQQLLGFVCDVRFIHWNRYMYSDTALTVVARNAVSLTSRIRTTIGVPCWSPFILN